MAMTLAEKKQLNDQAKKIKKLQADLEFMAKSFEQGMYLTARLAERLKPVEEKQVLLMLEREAQHDN